MKRAIAFPFLLLLAGCATSAVPMEPGLAATEEAAVRALDEQERAAVLAQDFEALERLWSEHFMVNNPVNQVTNGRGVALEGFRRGVAHYSSFERRVELVRVDGDVAVVMGAETVHPIGNSPLAGQTVERRFTNVWKKEGGAWHLWARHANVVSSR